MSKIHILIYGQVQGVGFRYWVRRKMEELGIVGEVWNNDDDTAELQAEGPEEQIKELIKLCHAGPALARVKKVVILKEEK
ncbi:MAG: acylphosphatase [Candidatus Beckwithbacteria bacterium]|nr:acylphosphatase [Candidatus Beckwithbacteria bacterium]